MSEGELEPRGVGSITIDQLLALNAEIVALVRAGVPLERGLVIASRDLGGRLGRIAKALSLRLNRGESLSQALEEEGRAIPHLYRAVVEAGARWPGQLPIALEGLARYVRGYTEARSAIGLALWYPLIVLSLAYFLFVAMVELAVPRFVAAFDSLRLAVPAPVRVMSKLGEYLPYWWLAGPVFMVVLFVAWIRTGAAARFGSRSWNWLRFFPWMKSILANYETANFSELLGLLLKHQVPYGSALVLAADSTGNPRLTHGARQMAAAIERGESATAALGSIDRGTFLPMLRWVLATGEQQGSLVTALENLTDVYRKRAHYQAEKLAVFLPTILMIAIGASATLFYCLTLFLPLSNMLQQLTGV